MVSGVLLVVGGCFAFDSLGSQKPIPALSGERRDPPAVNAVDENSGDAASGSHSFRIESFSKQLDLREWRTPPVAEAWLGLLGPWKSRRLVILAIFGAIVGEAILISVLFVERFSRKKAEKSLRQSQDRFRLLVESSPNGFVLIDGSHRIVLVNESAEKLFGYSRKELIGQAFDILVPDRFREHAIHPGRFLAAPMAPLTGGRREIFGCRKDGSEFPIEIGVSPIRTSEGVLVLTTIIDISARKRAEAEARQYRDELAHISRAETLGEMAASLAHELNQPLTGIMNNANAGRRFMAKGGADMRKMDSLFEAVVADARRAGEIIRGIRDMVKKGEGSLRTVNLNNIITETARIIHSDALERHCVISTELDPKIPLVTANPIQVQQVLLNIVINAFDAMRETPVTKRRVIIRSGHDADGQVQVRVRDFGSGLPAENPSRIFEQFYSTKRDGLGMGLAIARSIIAAHGGEMQAENAEGGGTCVSFLLPSVREELV
jgi:two-component system sensor kinase FixL